MDKLKHTGAREASYEALLSYLRDKKPVLISLADWKLRSQPEHRDFAFAQELVSGSVRMALALDNLASHLCGKTKFKPRERALVHLSLYQLHFMSRVPAHAVCHEMVALARKLIHPRWARFLNAILRRAAENPPKLSETPSIRYSMPQYLLDCLYKQYSNEQVTGVLEASNQAPVQMLRIRNPENCELSPTLPASVATIADLSDYRDNPDVYIQNVTPAFLISELAKSAPTPESVLDLCASPGGKLIASHDQYPKAAYFANDVSEKKLERLKENLQKYDIEASLHCGPGQEYPDDQRFDLIILDVPCSNTGVLGKRPEARWRLQSDNLEQLRKLQEDLLRKASSLLSDEGEIWLMTCSILSQENEELAHWACEELPLAIRGTPITILPTSDGWDGGFACAFVNAR